MNKDGPSNTGFQLQGGDLQYLPTQDYCFPYIYSLPSHTLVHSSEYVEKILVYIVDTSYEAHIKQAKFDHTLSVSLGPNSLMKEYGNTKRNRERERRAGERKNRYEKRLERS